VGVLKKRGLEFIRRGWEMFSKFVRYEVGAGSKVTFWHDVWCGDSSLKISNPDLFNITRRKDVWVASIINLFGVDWVMPRRVIDLLVSWGGQVGRGKLMEV
jgi:hypothetical protein